MQQSTLMTAVAALIEASPTNPVLTYKMNYVDADRHDYRDVVRERLKVGKPANKAKNRARAKAASKARRAQRRRQRP